MATIYRESMISGRLHVGRGLEQPRLRVGPGLDHPEPDLGHPEHGEEQSGARQAGGAGTPGGGARRAPGRRRTCSTATWLWKFSDKIELAKRFLVDLVAAADEGFRASEFYNLPCFPRAVPDLAAEARRGRAASPARKAAPGTPGRPLRAPRRGRALERLARAPGPVTPAIDETVQRGVIPAMFARAARGDQSTRGVGTGRRDRDAPHLRPLEQVARACWRRPSRAACPSRRGSPRRRRCGRRGGSRRRRFSRASGTRCSSRSATRSRPGSTW